MTINRLMRRCLYPKMNNCLISGISAVVIMPNKRKIMGLTDCLTDKIKVLIMPLVVFRRPKFVIIFF